VALLFEEVPMMVRFVAGAGAFALISLLSIGVASAQERPTGFDLSAEEIALLEAGETVVATRTGEVNRGQVIGLIDAGIRPLMEIVTDTNNQYIWFPDMLESEQISREENQGRSRGVTNMPWPISNRSYMVDGRYTQYTFDGAGCHAIEYQYVPDSGNMEQLFGYYLMCPFQGSDSRTLVKYVINADLGIWLPSSIIAWAQARLMPGVIEGLRDRYNTLH
jgi:hypothetical protein